MSLTSERNDENLNKRILLKDLDQSNPKLEKLLHYSSAYYIIVAVVIGLPVWYMTTTTYRVQLPYDDISKFSLNQYEITVFLELINADPKLNKVDFAKSEHYLFDKLKQNSNLAKGLKINFRGKSRQANEDELKYIQNTKSLIQLDENLSISNKNHLKIFVIRNEDADKYEINDKIEFLNSIYFVHDSEFSNLKQVVHLIFKTYLQIDQLVDVYHGKQDVKRKLPSEEQLRRLNYDSDYEITFSLINSKPNEFVFDWNIESSIQKYFTNIINQLSPCVNIVIKSQHFYYTEFEKYQSLIKFNRNEQFYYINSNDLSEITNYIESRLGSHISDSSTLNFVTYVPSKQPLNIIDNMQSNLKLNAFLVPRWGGIYIYNHLSETNNEMKVFLTQFFQLLGIKLHETKFNSKRNILFHSEIQSYLITKILENLSNSINTLKSLASLLEKISNMVINDDVGKQVHSSVESIKQCFQFLQMGDLNNAFNASNLAFKASEKAFFDPSLLELLYFPEDQKFAIYIPLFIPVGLPLVLSLNSIINWYKKNRKTEKPKLE